MTDWQDKTTYSRSSPRGKAPANDLELKVGFPLEFSILVHRLVGVDTWFLSCRVLGIQNKDLETQNLEYAKTKALVCVQRTMDVFVKSCTIAIQSIEELMSS